MDRLGKHTCFYRLNERGVYEELDVAQKGVIQSIVLKHFAFRIRDLEAQPPFETLIDDPLYQPFVLKSLQQERQQKEQALAEIERLRALLQQKS